MTYIKRDLESKIVSLSKEYSAILITGPRQVGKTTVLRQLMQKDRTYVTLDDLEERAPGQEGSCALPSAARPSDSYRRNSVCSRSFFHTLKSKSTMAPNPEASG